MNKQEFTEQLAERSDFSKAEAGRAVDAILETVTESLAERDEVSLPGFGKFVAQRRRGRDGSDPRHPDKKIRIPPAYVPKFRAGTALRRAVESSAAGAAGDARPAPNGSRDRRAERSGQERDEGREETAARAEPTERDAAPA